MDRITDMARTALNVVGNALAVLVIAKWEHQFDRKKALAYETEFLAQKVKPANGPNHRASPTLKRPGQLCRGVLFLAVFSQPLSFLRPHCATCIPA